MIITTNKPKVLYVDDDHGFLELLTLFFSREFNIITADNGDKALEILEGSQVDAVITDYDMPGINGLELLNIIKEKFPDVPVIFFTGQGNENIARDAFTNGASDYFAKEISGFITKEKMINSIHRAIEIKKTIKEKKESEDKYRYYINNAPDGIMVIDRTGTILEWNNALLDITGYTNEEMVDKKIFNIIAPESIETCRKHFSDLLNSNKFSSEAFIKHKNGTRIYMATDAVTIPGDKFLLFCKNLTLRKNTEEALQQSEERLRTLINSSPNLVCFKDGEGRWLEANQTMLELLQLTDIDYKGKKDSELAELSAFFREVFLKSEKTDEIAWEKGSFINKEGTVTLIDGTQKTYCIIKNPLFDLNGKRKGMITFGRDVTDSISSERALKESKAKYRSLTENSPDIIMRFDNELRHLYTNGTISEFFDIEASAFTGKTHRELGFEEEKCEFWEEKIAWVLNNNKTLETEFEIDTKKGRKVFNWRMIPECNEAGEVESILSVSRDVTKRVKAERDYQELLTDRNRIMEDFIYRVSHDLKNPVNIIKGYGEVIKEEPEMAGKYINNVIEKSNSILFFINRLLKLSRAGKEIGEKVSINLNEILLKIQTALIIKKVDYELIINDNVTELMGDPFGMEQVLGNLLENSIKYRDENKEKLIIKVDQENFRDSTRLIISDNGSGIPKEHLKDIFNPGTALKKDKGTGFGLAIVNKIIRAHKGSVWAESEGENRGVKFILEFPR